MGGDLSLAIDMAKLIGFDRQLRAFSELTPEKQQAELEGYFRQHKDEPHVRDVIDMYEGIMEGQAAGKTHAWKKQNQAALRIESAVIRVLNRRQAKQGGA